MQISAKASFHGYELTNMPVINPGNWFGKTWLLEIGGSYSPLFLIVEADSMCGAIDELAESEKHGHHIIVADEDLGDYDPETCHYGQAIRTWKALQHLGDSSKPLDLRVSLLLALILRLDAAVLPAIHLLRRMYRGETMATATAELKLETVFRALSDRTRLRILNLLRDGELCVCDLVDVLGVPQPTASRHLAYLRKAGLVLARKDGLWHYYRLSPRTSPFHKKLLECVAACETLEPEFETERNRLRATGCRDCCE